MEITRMNEAQRSECRAERLVKPLVLHLKREYWEAIRDGTKLEEYRERGPYWGRRLRNKEFSEVVLLLGYPKAGDESRTLRRKWKGYRETNITHPLFGENVPVFAIDVSERLNSVLDRPCKHDRG
jgi:hypothetical protein